MKRIKHLFLTLITSGLITSCFIQERRNQIEEDILVQHKEQTAKIEEVKDSVTELATSVPIYKQIEWNETLHDFTDVPSGPPAKTIFKFVNKSSIPVKITNLQPGCSCTTTDFSKGEINPNDTGFIEAAYKTSNTFGFFKKYISVYFNNEKGRQVLTITGNVDPMKH